jgi:hypothetical protein
MAHNNGRGRSEEARARRNQRKRERQKRIKPAKDRIADRMTVAQDAYLAGDVGELTDFELDILDTIHGDD